MACLGEPVVLVWLGYLAQQEQRDSMGRTQYRAGSKRLLQQGNKLAEEERRDSAVADTRTAVGIQLGIAAATVNKNELSQTQNNEFNIGA